MSIWMAPHGHHVERGSTRDARTMAEIHASGFHRGWPQSEFEAYLLDPQTTPTYVLCDAKHRVAGFALIRLAGDEAELLSIAVNARQRHKGFGAALMRAVIDDLVFSPAKSLFLEVEDGNEAAQKLYANLGFEEIGRREAYYRRPDGSAATALVMSLRLG